MSFDPFDSFHAPFLIIITAGGEHHRTSEALTVGDPQPIGVAAAFHEVQSDAVQRFPLMGLPFAEVAGESPPQAMVFQGCIYVAAKLLGDMV